MSGFPGCHGATYERRSCVRPGETAPRAIARLWAVGFAKLTWWGLCTLGSYQLVTWAVPAVVMH